MNVAIDVVRSCGQSRSAARRSTAMRWTGLSKVRVRRMCCFVVSSALSRVQREETDFFCALMGNTRHKSRETSNVRRVIDSSSAGSCRQDYRMFQDLHVHLENILLILLTAALQILRNQWNYATRHVDGGFNMTSMREVSGDVNSTHVCLKSFRIIHRHFSKFTRLSLHAEL